MRWAERPTGRSIRYTRALLRYHGAELANRLGLPAAAVVICSFVQDAWTLHVAVTLPLTLFVNAWLAVAVHRAALDPERADGSRVDRIVLGYAAALVLLALLSALIATPLSWATFVVLQSVSPDNSPTAEPLAILPMLAAALITALLAARLLGASFVALPMLATDGRVDYDRAKRIVRPWTLDIAVLLFVLPSALSLVSTAIAALPELTVVSALVNATVDIVFAIIAVLLLSYLYRALLELDALSDRAADAVATAIAKAQASAQAAERPGDAPERPADGPEEPPPQD